MSDAEVVREQKKCPIWCRTNGWIKIDWLINEHEWMNSMNRESRLGISSALPNNSINSFMLILPTDLGLGKYVGKAPVKRKR